ncbi:hypothetical protein [Corynebacterium glucuronolyticum]|uniref:hypothetical protein n=1 Tax=Corynebacterium glucuronolyticum TaxID=39791 RepID=UPI00019C2156|nr:hypothetical protein [Corynebacterium glucuronolyticum]EEI27912.1 hypothetical protein HMPREF0294_0526 [Corynebacterium glucuronolyticum ATCC 51867]QRO81958.1 hypothetical protein I6J20_08755 [Corynebacterium glucuronolyticum]
MSNHTPDNRLDMPDHYTGNWHTVKLTHISIDFHEGICHLMMKASPQGSYCTRFNPRRVYNLTSTRLSATKGWWKEHGLYVNHSGLSPAAFMPEHMDGGHLCATVDGHRMILTPCPDCLTLACVEAEMIGQRDYPVKTLMNKIERLPDTTSTTPGNRRQR